MYFKCTSSSIKILNENEEVLFKAKCKGSFSKVWDQFTYKISIDSAKFTYGDYFKEKELENDAYDGADWEEER